MGGLKVRCTHLLVGHHRARGRTCESWYGPSKLNISLRLTYHQTVFFPLILWKTRGEGPFPSPFADYFAPRKKKKERLIASHFMVKMFGFNEKRIILASVCIKRISIQNRSYLFVTSIICSPPCFLLRFKALMRYSVWPLYSPLR